MQHKAVTKPLCSVKSFGGGGIAPFSLTRESSVMQWPFHCSQDSRTPLCHRKLKAHLFKKYLTSPCPPWITSLSPISFSKYSLVLILPSCLPVFFSGPSPSDHFGIPGAFCYIYYQGTATLNLNLFDCCPHHKLLRIRAWAKCLKCKCDVSGSALLIFTAYSGARYGADAQSVKNLKQLPGH